MKVLNIFLPVFLFAIFFVACQNDKSSEKDVEIKTTEAVAENLKQVKAEISGMTCEIGCARLIQSKLYKTDGVSLAAVSFEDSSGLITYDANRVSEEDLKRVIEKAGGGDLYRVTAMYQVTQSSVSTDR